MTSLPIDNSIRRLRFEHGEMTQQALAEQVGVTRQTINAIELGAANHLRRPHAEEAFAVQRVDYGLGKLAVLVSIIGVLVRERTDAFRTLR